MKLLPLALAALAAAAAHAETAPAGAPAAPDAEKKICRSVTVTGSMMPRRTCHTREEWKQVDAADADAVQQYKGMPVGLRGTTGN